MATSAAHQAGLPDNLKTEEILDLIFRSTGGINPFLGLGNLRGMPFPVLEAKEHRRIGDLVQETVEKAYAAEREASNLLEQAKRRVEELVEQEAG